MWGNKLLMTLKQFPVGVREVPRPHSKVSGVVAVWTSDQDHDIWTEGGAGLSGGSHESHGKVLLEVRMEASVLLCLLKLEFSSWSRVAWRYARGIITSDDSLFAQWKAPQLDRVVLDPIREENSGKT